MDSQTLYRIYQIYEFYFFRLFIFLGLNFSCVKLSRLPYVSVKSFVHITVLLTFAHHLMFYIVCGI